MRKVARICSFVTRVPAGRLEWLVRAVLASAFLATILSTGCSLREWVHNGFKVGPNYCKPAAPVASEWIDYADPRVRSDQPSPAEWWHVFGDPALDCLIETAYRQNITLREAGTRILAARAERGIAVGELFPQAQDVYGGYQRVGTPRNWAVPLPKRFFSNWDTGFGAAWEVDFWGRFRRAIEAADCGLDASIENYDDVLVILLADVATSYTQLRVDQDRLRYAWLNIVSQYNGYQLAATRFITGTATERDLQQARQVLEQTQAQIPQLETAIRHANNQLCILLGVPPHELSELEVGTYEKELIPLKETVAERVGKIESTVLASGKNGQKRVGNLPELLTIERDPKVALLLKPLEARQRTPVAPQEVLVGIPADLLRRRPDVRRAEREVAAQSARIGVAKADLYPHFTILGTIGLDAEFFPNLFSPGSMFGAVGPSFRWDILNYGRIRNNIRVQDAQFQGLAYTYQSTVLEAGKEAEDGITDFLNSQEQTRSLQASVKAANRTVEISLEQYRGGTVDFTPVVLFENTLASQQDSLAVARGNIALGLIAVYRALGGGWEMRLARDGGPACAQGREPATAGAEGPLARGPGLLPGASGSPAARGYTSTSPAAAGQEPVTPAKRLQDADTDGPRGGWSPFERSR